MMINTVDSNTTVTWNGQQPTANTASPSGEAVFAVAQPELATIQATVTKLNDHVQNISNTLSFSIDATTGRTIIRVYDSETRELIREIPSEETIKMAADLDSYNAIHLLKGQQA